MRPLADNFSTKEELLASQQAPIVLLKAIHPPAAIPVKKNSPMNKRKF
jgi:hypothetical protein